MTLPRLEDLPPVEGKRVLVRCDFNVPLEDGRITDDNRIRASLPTLKWLLDRGAHVIVCSHLGRPKGRPDPALSLAPIAARLGDLVDVPVRMGDEAVGGEVVVLENLRFDPGEEKNDEGFARSLADKADLYVDDAFGAVHRSHASVDAVARLLPHAAGRLLEREVEVLTRLRESPERPFVVVLGGAKVSDKLALLHALVERADRILVGGGMCFTLLKAQGGRVGESLVEDDRVDEVRPLLASGKLVLPTDVVAADAFSPDAAFERVPAGDVPDGWRGLDIAGGTAAAFEAEIATAGTVFWNGPMGVFEWEAFSSGTRAVASAVARCTGFTVVGGGDSGAALVKYGLVDEVDHLSTGGGASLELLEKGDLPGLAALRAP